MRSVICAWLHPELCEETHIAEPAPQETYALPFADAPLKPSNYERHRAFLDEYKAVCEKYQLYLCSFATYDMTHIDEMADAWKPFAELEEDVKILKIREQEK